MGSHDRKIYVQGYQQLSAFGSIVRLPEIQVEINNAHFLLFILIFLSTSFVADQVTIPAAIMTRHFFLQIFCRYPIELETNGIVDSRNALMHKENGLMTFAACRFRYRERLS